MNKGIDSINPVTYKVVTPIFDGPLDLLLFLIEKSQLDITKLSLSMVTNQYLEYIQIINNFSPDNLSEFLIVATKLLQIKSESLLPKPPTRQEDEEDPGELLARQLQEYKIYKTAAGVLEYFEKKHQPTFLRIASPIKIEGSLDIDDLSLEDLFNIAKTTFETPQSVDFDSSIISPKISIRDKINLIRTKLIRSRSVLFSSLIYRNSNYLEIVVTFLAILELMKMKRVIVEQTALFSDFLIESSVEIVDDDLNFELEFD